MRSFGVKNVDLGGISSPSRAVRSISATLTGRISTPAAAAPDRTASSTRSTPCWYVTSTSTPAERVLEPGAVEGAHPVEHAGLGDQPGAVAGRVDEAQRVPRAHLRQGRTIDRTRRLEIERRSQAVTKLIETGADVQPVDGVDAELVGDELAHEGERELGRGVLGTGRSADLVAVRAGDAIPMMAVGDEHVVRADRITNGGDALGIGEALDAVLDAVDA